MIRTTRPIPEVQPPAPDPTRVQEFKTYVQIDPDGNILTHARITGDLPPPWIEMPRQLDKDRLLHMPRRYRIEVVEGQHQTVVKPAVRLTVSDTTVVLDGNDIVEVMLVGVPEQDRDIRVMVNSLMEIWQPAEAHVVSWKADVPMNWTFVLIDPRYYAEEPGVTVSGIPPEVA